MIQHAFTSAKMDEAQSQSQSNSHVWGAVKEVGTAIAAAYGAGVAAKAAKYNLAGKVGGIGGEAMLSTMEDKTDNAKSMREQKTLINASDEEIENVFTRLSNESKSEQEDVAIDTVWNKLMQQRDKNKTSQVEQKAQEMLREGE